MRRIATKILSCFEWGDNEYLRGEWRGAYPWVVWLTIYEESWRRGWRRILPWRIRFALASVLIDVLNRRCPGCGKRFTYADLIGRGESLQRFMSGTTWHARCESSGWMEGAGKL